MRYLVVLVVLFIMVAGCSSTAQESEPVPTPVPLKLANEVETEKSDLTPSPGLKGNIKEGISQNESEGGDDGQQGAGEASESDVVGPSGSLNLKEVSSDDQEIDDPRGDLVVQPAPIIADDRAKLEKGAVQKLSDRLGVDSSEVSVISIDAVEWPDGSLGCPPKDMMTIQVITPGFLIVLEVKDMRYEYHTDRLENLVLCLDGQPAPGE